MSDLPKRKPNRIEDYDYSTPGAYFVTVCTTGREKLFWSAVGADIIRPQDVPLSPMGKIVEQGKHLELLHKRGYYHDLYSKQFAEENAARVLND